MAVLGIAGICSKVLCSKVGLLRYCTVCMIRSVCMFQSCLYFCKVTHTLYMYSQCCSDLHILPRPGGICLNTNLVASATTPYALQAVL